MDKRKVSVAIPVFRNAASLDELYAQLVTVAEETFPDLDLEIIFTDDGSDDNSWEVIRRIQAADPDRVAAYKLSRNFGQVSAMVSGLGKATGDAVINMSADLQDPTELVGTMVQRWRDGSEIVIAHRESRDDGLMNTLTSRIAYRVARSAIPNMPDGGFDYFLMSRRAVTELLKFQGRFRFIQGDLLWLGLPMSFVPYKRLERKHGKSAYNFRKRFNIFVDLLIDSSYGPIRMMSRLGLFAALGGLAYLALIVISWLRGNTPFDGWSPIMVTILILNGLVMIMLGLIGEYLWRIHDEVRSRPIHVIEQSYPAKD